MKRFLLTLALFAAAIFVLRRLAGALGGSARRQAPGEGAAKAGGGRRLVRDPICLTYVPADTALELKGAGEKGSTLWFCSDRCRSSWLAGRRAAS